jgi:hypothetical protein
MTEPCRAYRKRIYEDMLDERPCQVAAYRGQIELGEIMVRTRISDGFSCGNSRFYPCWFKASGEDGLGP